MDVQLRPLVLTDWPAVHSWARREDFCTYQAWGPNTPAQTHEFVHAAAAEWTREPQIRFPHAVLLDDEVRGIGELKIHSSSEGEISYGVHPDSWGRGIGAALGRGLLRIGFADHGLHRIFGTCDPRNLGSGRVLRKLGMSYEGRKRETLLIRSGWRDSELYSILEHEWREQIQQFEGADEN